MKRFLICLTLSFALTGCSAVSHLQELLRLNAYSKEKTIQHRYIQSQRDQFDRMLVAARAGETAEFATTRQVSRAYGPPVFRRPVEHNGQGVTQWLYRYPKAFFDAPKVYLYYDDQGRLVDWTLWEPPPASSDPPPVS